MASKGKTQPRYVVLGGVGSTSLVVLFLVCLGAIPREAAQVLVIAIVVGWLAFAIFSIVRRFGWPAVVVLAFLFSTAAIWGWYKYQDDLANRRLVAQVEEQGNVRVITKGMWTGSFWTGDVYYLYFEAGMAESDVRRILRLPGLDKLERVVFKGTPITDATLAELIRLPSLHDVYIEGGDISDAGVQTFLKARPNCNIEVR